MGKSALRGMPGRYELSPATLTDGQSCALLVDSVGRLVISGTISVGSVDLSEFPAAAALSDAFANPTTSSVGAMDMLWNGATWDRWPGTAAAGGKVQVSLALPAGTNAIGGITGGGSNSQIKDDTFYGEGVTSGILSAASRLWNGTGYDRWKGYFPFLNGRVTADGQIKASAGFVHCISVSPTAAVSTAGTITVYDNTAESGTVLATIFCPTNDTVVKTIPIDCVAGTGIYVGFDATVTAHSVNVSYV
jgi:hypothetical protein